MHAVASASARRATTDPRYATLEAVLIRARDSNLATARALKLDRVEKATKHELATIKAVDENDFPIGKENAIRSVSGVIDFGNYRLTSREFLLLMQSDAYQSGRGFVAGSDYECTVGAFCRRNFWQGRTVRYFFDNSLTSDDQRWMTNQMTLIRNTTGMRFRKVSNTGWVRFWHSLSLSDDLKISKQNLPSNLRGRATVGRVGSSILQMNTAHVQEKSVFHHEMGHVFGLLHEHQRYDRNTYVRASRRGSDYNAL